MRILAWSSIAVAITVAGRATQSVSAAPSKKPVAVPGELIVGFEPGVAESAQADVLAKAGATKKKGLKQIRAALAGVSENRVAAVTKALESDPRVRYVEPNHVVSIAALPDDPEFTQLWGLHNTGQSGGTPDADIDAPEAWDLETGSSSVVAAVTDTGVDFSHPDLAAQQWINPGENCGSSDPGIPCAERTNGLDDDGDGYVDDYRGWDFVNGDNNPTDDNNHGTHVSGTIGAVGDNGVGVVGVNWNVRIMALKFLNSAGSGTSADAAAATIYAADHGAAVSNNSWGGGPPEQVLQDAVDYAAAHGMLFVAAAGNDGTNNDSTPFYPAAYGSDDLVAVAATDRNDNLSSFSNYGATSVDLGAPGSAIVSTVPGGSYQSFSGTSMASPHVSGAAALLKAHFPGATAYGIKALLMRSVDTKASLTGKTVTDGRLNLFNAVSCSDAPKVVLGAPADGFGVGVGDSVPIKVIGANCASPAGLGSVSVTVNDSPVTLTSASPDSGLYTGSFTPGAEGALTVSATVTVDGSSASQTVTGTAVRNYACTDVSDSWVDVTPGTRLVTASDNDDAFSTVNIGFPFGFYGQTYTTAYVSSNGFLTLGSSAGADAFANVGIPNATMPNGVVAPFWDDLNPSGLFGGSGDVYAGLTGPVGARVLHVEWFNVAHFSLSGSGTATFEMSLYQATGELRFRYLDTDLGNASWNAGASATAGLETPAGTIGRQISFNQPLLTSGRAVSCTLSTPPPPTPPTVTTTSLADATNGEAYSATLAATGGSPPYTWSLPSGSLPTGLTLDPATGAITGTPSATPGSYPFTAQVTDSLSQTDTQALSITVLASPPTVTTTSLADATNGEAYSATLAATGGSPPYTWSLPSGSLPTGLTLDPATGAITGTPSATPGSYPFTAQVTDSLSQTDTQALSISLTDPLAVTTTSLPGGTVGQAYSQVVTATGGQAPYVWSLFSGVLPAGLSLNAVTGAITGTPTAAGTSNFTVQASDAGSPTRTDTQALSITVSPAPTLTVTTASLPEGRVGVTYSAALAASGGLAPYAWSRASGTLPPGLTLNASGVISGTPTKKGNFTFTVRVTDANGAQATRTLSIRVRR